MYKVFKTENTLYNIIVTTYLNRQFGLNLILISLKMKIA